MERKCGRSLREMGGALVWSYLGLGQPEKWKALRGDVDWEEVKVFRWKMKRYRP